MPDGTEGEIRVWAQLQRFAWAHGCDDPARCARKHCKTRACPAGCTRHRGTCPPPCPAGCARHALHCPKRTLPRGSIRLNGALVLRETVKEKKRKTVPIPAGLCEVLRDHRSAQFEQRMLAGSEWTDHDLVFTRWDGQPVDPRRDWQEWARILAAAGIPHSGVHTGRHTAATIAIDQGAAITAVQELLGHSSVQVTKGYVHTSSPSVRAAARAMGKALFGDDE